MSDRDLGGTEWWARAVEGAERGSSVRTRRSDEAEHEAQPTTWSPKSSPLGSSSPLVSLSPGIQVDKDKE